MRLSAGRAPRCRAAPQCRACASVPGVRLGAERAPQCQACAPVPGVRLSAGRAPLRLRARNDAQPMRGLDRRASRARPPSARRRGQASSGRYSCGPSAIHRRTGPRLSEGPWRSASPTTAAAFDTASGEFFHGRRHAPADREVPCYPLVVYSRSNRASRSRSDRRQQPPFPTQQGQIVMSMQAIVLSHGERAALLCAPAPGTGSSTQCPLADLSRARCRGSHQSPSLTNCLHSPA